MSAKKKSSHKKNQKPAKPARTAPAAAPRAHRTGLGRGLGALIGRPQSADTLAQAAAIPPKQHPAMSVALPSGGAADTAPAADAVRTIFDVPVAEIARSPWQPRQTFDEEALRELTDSIKANGMIQPLVCRKNSEGRYELVAGERRLRAAIDAGMAKVPVILVDAEDRRAAELTIIENIQREDLNAIEEAEGYNTLVASFNLTQQEVADRVGKARATVANALRLLELPDEVKQLVGSGLLSTGHAKVLLGLADTTEQMLLARKCVTEGLTVRSLEKVIRKRKAAAAVGDDVRRSGKPDLPESYVRDLCDRLHKHFGTAVRLYPGVTHANGRHTKGVLEIDFYDNDDLDRVLALLGIELD
jgi:ParB family chromosome partitioning protein